MNRFRCVVAIGVAGAMASGAAAADLDVASIAWKAAPTKADVDAALPKGWAGQGEGFAWLRCQLNADGSLSGCSADYSSDPESKHAALRLVPKFTAFVPPILAAGKDRLFVDIRFTFHDTRQTRPPVELTTPELLQAPGSAPAAPHPFPDAAAKMGWVSGVGVIDCDGVAGGGLANCAVAREAPGNVGFGQEALEIARTLRLNPWQDGEAVEGARLRLPLYVDAPNATADPNFTRKAIFHVPMGWSGTAGPYYPERAFRMNIRGSATIQCVLAASGSLSDCKVVSESPEGQAFAAAALKMASRGAILAKPTIVDGRPREAESVRVEVPFVP
jgi:TonB family protein